MNDATIPAGTQAPWVDPECWAVLELTNPHPGNPHPLLQTLTPDMITVRRPEAEQRKATDDVLRLGGRLRFEELTIPGPGNRSQIPALILTPATGSGPWPCLYYVSCGGKVISGTRLGLELMGFLDWLADFGAVGVVVAPRVGPEHPHPAQVEDAYTGLVWLSEHAADHNIDPDRVLILGVSGGGGIAAATALMARDHGGPAVSHQILVTPMIDDRAGTVSSRFEGVLWGRGSNRTGWRAILGDACGGPDVSPYAAPSRAVDLSRLPATYLDAGSADTFRDETIDYAARLATAGVPLELHIWAGAMHGQLLIDAGPEVARAAIAARTNYVQRALRPQRHEDIAQ